MRHHRIPTLFLAFLALVLALPAGARAQAPSIQGTFVYDASASDNVNQAIETAISRMNFVIRPIARGRLKKTNQPYHRIAISHTNSEISVKTDNRAPIVTPANGTPKDWTREDGEKLKVSTEWENGKIVQTFRAEDGQRINTYSVSPDGSVLSMLVTIRSEKLPKPLTYTLRYRRAS